MVPFEWMRELVGRTLPGGSFELEHYRNWLTNDVLGSPQRNDDLAHPMFCYYATIGGMGLSIAELFELAHSSAEDGPMFGECDMEVRLPLRTGTTYEVRGEITDVKRKQGGAIGTFDLLTFRLEVLSPGGAVAGACTNSFIFPRQAVSGDHARSVVPPEPSATGTDPPSGRGDHPAASTAAVPTAAVPTAAVPTALARRRVAVGDELPERIIESVSAEKMKTMAALLGDPNSIHWDTDALRRLGLGERPVNQGPNNMGYVVDMLADWAGGPEGFRRLTVRFAGNVFAGDRLVAGGRVTATRPCPEGQLVDCEVWLTRDGAETVLTGTATVSLAS